MFILIDNYDSFTYNLYHYFSEIGANVEVYRNDKITINELKLKNPTGIILSPGPCTPNDAGICMEIIKKLGVSIPILGVCLGHQSIGQVYGGKVIRSPYLMHGKVSLINHQNKTIFNNIKSPFKATRYHSLIIEKNNLPSCLDITAETEDGIIMGLSHKQYPVHGVQFHPESIASECGHDILQNFINISNNFIRKAA
ncbi:MAG: aminodeoxychorismate/anthranilate synthase component II [Kordiimonadaceae bacterium]|jgi:anthranilate synthase component II|nr:aminodeoxychorismate/anthranilate synthase component II [Kordiimonadaceae bacterium]MDC0081080.1 aminodeoxychorismate/anthranilate synthase component II [Emcibacteraceae bacterium]MBT6134745.1 aminodeoxychorismate/anthranilate synthase component II [Kordiimonadaceae bacterium]MBT6466996.1 aminodeoxychorismate/anthranilate synthase component II [Kordiimonadaceae bacterium]MBT7545115.1 aminodeoxychorismate/anthranilate synthase component II [Kordiimonadaceae bacterium]|tara:strand:- start:4522 stop:5112 length:591 start_codon:yes stop_codon:yes gene_type:complete